MDITILSALKNKNPTIDIVKGLAIILVVYGHVIEHGMAPQGKDFFLNPVFKVIYTFHMPLFVFISGYLVALSLKKRSPMDVFKRKFDSLLVPFVSLAILGIIVSYGLNILFANNSGGVNFLQDLLDQLLLKPSVWFLFTLFILNCLLLCSVHWAKRFGPAIFLGTYFLILVIPYNDYFCFYYIKWFYLFFLAGYFISPYDLRITHQTIRTVAVGISVLIFIGLLPYWTTQDYIYINRMNFESHRYVYEIVRIVYRYMMGFLGIMISFYTGKYLTRTPIASFLESVGTYSLDIYIIQMCIVEGIYPRLMGRAHGYFDFNSPWVLYVGAPVLTMFFVGLCMLISKLLIRKDLLLGRVLLGGRV